MLIVHCTHLPFTHNPTLQESSSIRYYRRTNIYEDHVAGAQEGGWSLVDSAQFAALNSHNRHGADRLKFCFLFVTKDD